jgi:phage tail sheath protein FI
MFQGGFDGVNIFDAEKAELTGIASLREGEDETNSQKFTGPTIMAYQRAIDVLTDKSATEFQLLAIPGQRSPRVTDYAITACEDRFDAMLIMDIVEKDALNSLIEDSEVKPHVRNTISLFTDRVLDTSFAAAYFPDVVIQRPSDNAPIVVPPSVGMLGVMSRNDAIADPWFAPAGLNRGRLSAIDSRVQMNRDLLDDLYDADINPIYVPAGRSGEVYAFGQKTLLQDQSALDRINVRRLLIDIRRKVKKVGEQLLFEPNRASTLSRFSSLVEPIMANVQERRGVTRYKVQIDSSTTTQNDIENNTIRGKIYLQPTKSVEFISLDFVVTNTIQQ